MALRWTTIGFALALIAAARGSGAEDRRPATVPDASQLVAAPNHAAAPGPSATAAIPTPSRNSRQRRQKWDQALQATAKLDFGDRQEITLGELIQHIRKQHGLPVRIDTPHVLPLAALLTIHEPQPPLAYRAPAYHPVTPVAASVALPESVAAAAPLPPPIISVTSASPRNPSDELQPEPKSPLEAVPLAPTNVPPVSAAPMPIEAGDEISADSPTSDDSTPELSSLQTALKSVLEHPLQVSEILDDEATVEDVLRKALDLAVPLQWAMNSALAEELPIPMSLTRAAEWELLIQDDGVLLTTRLNANLRKEVRVYPVRRLEQSCGLKAEAIARAITRTVRPWSWRTTFDDAPKPPPTPVALPSALKKRPPIKMNLDLNSLLGGGPARQVRLANNEEEQPANEAANWEMTSEDLVLLGRMWDAIFQGSVSTLQVIYQADPPTGVIDVLPGLLVITQSQAAHRDIADLLDQLAAAGQ